MKILIIIWLLCSLFVDSVPPAPDGSKWGARFKTLGLRLLGPVGVIETQIRRYKNRKKK